MVSRMRTFSLALVIVGTTVFVGCRTTSPTVRVNKSEKQITVYSAADKNTSLADPRKSGHIRNSIKVVQDKLRKDPTNVNYLLDLASLYLVQENFADARESCRKALTFNLKNVSGRKLLGRIELESGNTDKAEIIFNGLGGASSKDSEILNSLGIISLRKADYAMAFAMFNQGIKISPDNIAIRMNLGTLLLKFKQVQPASVQFERVLQIIPDHADALMHLAIAKATRGDYKQAQELYTRVLKTGSGNPIVRFNLAVTQREQGNLNEALDNVRLFLKQKDIPMDKHKAAEVFRDQIENEIEKLKREKEKKKREAEIQALSAKNPPPAAKVKPEDAEDADGIQDAGEAP